MGDYPFCGMYLFRNLAPPWLIPVLFWDVFGQIFRKVFEAESIGEEGQCDRRWWGGSGVAAAPSRLSFPKVPLWRVARTRKRSRDSPVNCPVRTSLASWGGAGFCGTWNSSFGTPSSRKISQNWVSKRNCVQWERSHNLEILESLENRKQVKTQTDPPVLFCACHNFIRFPTFLVAYAS